MSVSMIPTSGFEELAIVIVAKNHNPTMLTLDFLQSSGIVPLDWKLAEPAVLNSHRAEVQFTNDTIISTKYDSIIFSQTIENKPLEDIKIPAIVRKYIQTLPNVDYQGLEINPSTFVTFEDENKGAFRHYIATSLLSSGAWHDFGKEPVIATLHLGYTLERGKFNLKIDDVRLLQTDNTPQSAVLFSGNFHYEIAGNTSSERLQYLCRLIDSWQNDFKTYRELVNQRFLDKPVQ
ncbi:MAG: hypothetical protein SAK29_00195 [Scytonema sp. PMC 1069.18]|nr:hypothetical protein [Scytonema sp. PMC 1069.18]MEC4883408.1 hypothetical protein [Scytonema sp. PMC 1070.18]